MASRPTLILGRPCDRCGQEQVAFLFDNLDYISGESFALVRCTTCDLVRTVFPHEPADLGRYYGDSYYGRQGRRFIGPMEWAVRQFREARARVVQRLQPGRAGTILDVGCGRGLMLISLKARGWTGYGTELSTELVETLRARHGLTVFAAPDLTGLPLEAGMFDVVTLWHSLEHVPHPADVIAQATRVLRPGGHLIVEVPNFASLQARIGRGRWFHLDAPRHLTHFTPETLAGLLATCGLQVIGWQTLSVEQGFYGMWQTLLNRITGEPNVLYSLLKRRRPRGRRSALVRDISLTALLLLPVAIVGTLLEGGAILAGQGAVIRIVARKAPRAADTPT